MSAGLEGSLQQLQRRVLAGREEQARAFVLGSRLVGGTVLHLRFEPARPIEKVRVHVQSTASGEGGGDYDAVNYTSDETVDCRGSRVQDYEVTLDPAERYFVWVIPLVRAGDGTYSERLDEAEFLDMAPEGSALWEPVGTVAATMATHLAASDPHTQYHTDARGDARYSLLGHTHAFASLTAKPTTLAGYGIADARALTDVDFTGRGAATFDAGLTIAGQTVDDIIAGSTINHDMIYVATGGNGYLLVNNGANAIGQITYPAGSGKFLKAQGAQPTWNTLVASDVSDFASAVAATPPASHVHAAADITSGTLALARGGTAADNSSQAANLVFASPDGSTGAASWRALVSGDIPNLSAAKITSGTLALARGGTAADNSSQAANLVFASPSSGGSGAASWRALVAADIPNLDAGKITSGALAKAQQHAQTAYLDAAAGQAFANRQTMTGGLTIGAVSGNLGQVTSSALNTNGFFIQGRAGTTYAMAFLNDAGNPFLRVANGTQTCDMPAAATVGTTLTVGTNVILTSPTTATSASAGAQTLPANPVGFLVVSIAGTSRKIPYYAT